MRPVIRCWFVAMVASALWLVGPAGFAAEEGNPLIVPGKSVGEIRLGMELPEVCKRLGDPANGEGAAGRAWDAWFGHKEGGGRGYELDTYAHLTAISHDKAVEAIRVESPFFHTKDGINTASSLTNIWKTFPGAHYSPSDLHDPAVEIYEDDEHGIAFEIRRTFTSAGSVPPPGAAWGACQAIIVFGAGERLSPIHSMRDMPDVH